MLIVFIYIVLLALVLPVLVVTFFAIGGVLFRPAALQRVKPLNKIAVYFPAYKEDNVIVDSVRNVLQQRYHFLDRKMFDVIVIAQHLQASTLQQLAELDCKVVNYNVKQSTKVKALQHAIQLPTTRATDYDISMILDADNHLGADVLLQVNDALTAGNVVVQCHRTAKNVTTPFALLDALAEEINNTLFRKGNNFFHFSASLIGSGIAFNTKMFIDYINNARAIAGFDKEINIELLRAGHFITYLQTALVYDEKVPNQQIFEQQRTRWNDSQAIYSKKYIVDGYRALREDNNIDFFVNALQNLLPARLLLLAGCVFVVVVTALLGGKVFAAALLLCALYVSALCISIPNHLWRWQLLYALLQLPNALISMLKSWLQLDKSKRQFLHTPHGTK